MYQSYPAWQGGSNGGSNMQNDPRISGRSINISQNSIPAAVNSPMGLTMYYHQPSPMFHTENNMQMPSRSVPTLVTNSQLQVTQLVTSTAVNQQIGFQQILPSNTCNQTNLTSEASFTISNPNNEHNYNASMLPASISQCIGDKPNGFLTSNIYNNNNTWQQSVTQVKPIHSETSAGNSIQSLSTPSGVRLPQIRVKDLQSLNNVNLEQIVHEPKERDLISKSCEINTLPPLPDLSGDISLSTLLRNSTEVMQGAYNNNNNNNNNSSNNNNNNNSNNIINNKIHSNNNNSINGIQTNFITLKHLNQNQNPLYNGVGSDNSGVKGNINLSLGNNQVRTTYGRNGTTQSNQPFLYNTESSNQPKHFVPPPQAQNAVNRCISSSGTSGSSTLTQVQSNKQNSILIRTNQPKAGVHMLPVQTVGNSRTSSVLPKDKNSASNMLKMFSQSNCRQVNASNAAKLQGNWGINNNNNSISNNSNHNTNNAKISKASLQNKLENNSRPSTSNQNSITVRKLPSNHPTKLKPKSENSNTESGNNEKDFTVQSVLEEYLNHPKNSNMEETTVSEPLDKFFFVLANDVIKAKEAEKNATYKKSKQVPKFPAGVTVQKIVKKDQNIVPVKNDLPRVGVALSPKKPGPKSRTMLPSNAEMDEGNSTPKTLPLIRLVTPKLPTNIENNSSTSLPLPKKANDENNENNKIVSPPVNQTVIRHRLELLKTYVQTDEIGKQGKRDLDKEDLTSNPQKIRKLNQNVSNKVSCRSTYTKYADVHIPSARNCTSNNWDFPVVNVTWEKPAPKCYKNRKRNFESKDPERPSTCHSMSENNAYFDGVGSVKNTDSSFQINSISPRPLTKLCSVKITRLDPKIIEEILARPSKMQDNSSVSVKEEISSDDESKTKKSSEIPSKNDSETESEGENELTSSQIENKMKAFRSKDHQRCIGCAKTVPTSGFWINVVSEELRCVGCLSKWVAKSEKEFLKEKRKKLTENFDRSENLENNKEKIINPSTMIDELYASTKKQLIELLQTNGSELEASNFSEND